MEIKLSHALIFLLAGFVVKFVSPLPSLTVQQDPGLLENIAEKIGKPCPNGWNDFGDHCYLVSGSIKSWSQAQTYCKNLGGDLVKITSQEENDFILELVRDKAASLNQVWIGMKWDSTSKKFYWSDNSIPTFTNWAPNEPNSNGGEPCSNMWIRSNVLPVRSAGSWNDLTCNVISQLPLGLVCKKPQ